MPYETIAAAAQALRAGETTARAIAEEYLERISAIDDAIHAFAAVTADRARADADRADAELRQGETRGPLHGIPIALKDLIMTRGIVTAAGSDVLAGNVPDADADVARNLDAAGMVLIGKTTTHEFAWGVFTPPARNPWSLDRVPGGSSGGSAAAIAAGLALGAVGSDTGGSIRIPSACCGVTGFKPTYGLVSARGVIELSASLDHIGPIARTAEDCALLLDALAPDHDGAPFAGRLREPPLDPARVAVLGGPWRDASTADVLARVDDAIGVLAPGARTVTWPDLDIDRLFALYATIQGAEASAYHRLMGWYPARAERYTVETRKRLERTSAIPAIDYIAARRELAHIVQQWRGWIADERIDVLLAPTLPITAPFVADVEDPARRTPLREALLRLTYPFNLLGVPALTVPCGTGADGMPVGLQIVTPGGEDALALRVGHAFQQRTDWHRALPPL